MKTYFGYIRVSTARQGERGVSLQEQRDAILRYAERHQLEISRWFEERETAAKLGRPGFNEMLKLLRADEASGVMIHKIDRSARNMKDWAELGELIDRGVEVHFVNESLDLASRGGRLSADIQAVVSADYIRNLREESRKGFYGRIKQGLYPLPAPLGYLDMGQGKPKEPDPVRAPLVGRAFELYATASWTLEELCQELYRSGLRNRRGGAVSLNGLSTILNNPFYIGIIRLMRTGETFSGIQEPLIAKSLFDRVRLVLQGKVAARTQVHDFLFRRILKCGHCGYALIGERQKGHVYYRCHTKDCPTNGIREEAAETVFSEALEPLRFDDDERVILLQKLGELKEDLAAQWEAETKASRLQLDQLRDRLDRLTDAYIDRLIDKEAFEDRKTTLLMEQKTLEEKVAQPERANLDRLSKFLELAGDACLLYQTSLPGEKRDLLKIVTSNRTVSGKNIAVALKDPFLDVVNRYISSNGRADGNRTLVWPGSGGRIRTLNYALFMGIQAQPCTKQPIYSIPYWYPNQDSNLHPALLWGLESDPRSIPCGGWDSNLGLCLVYGDQSPTLYETAALFASVRGPGEESNRYILVGRGCRNRTYVLSSGGAGIRTLPCA
jgi:DNA invertase Pin-like site-specific DNA recombinase